MKKILEQCKGKKIKLSIPVFSRENSRIDNCFYVVVSRNSLECLLQKLWEHSYDLDTVAVDTETTIGIVYVSTFYARKLKS